MILHLFGSRHWRAPPSANSAVKTLRVGRARGAFLPASGLSACVRRPAYPLVEPPDHAFTVIGIDAPQNHVDLRLQPIRTFFSTPASRRSGTVPGRQPVSRRSSGLRMWRPARRRS